MIAKILTAVNDDCQQLLSDNELQKDSQWFEEQDERIFSFKTQDNKMIKIS